MTKELTEFGPVYIGQLGKRMDICGPEGIRRYMKETILFYHKEDDDFPVNFYPISEDLIDELCTVMSKGDRTKVILYLDDNNIIALIEVLDDEDVVVDVVARWVAEN